MCTTFVPGNYGRLASCYLGDLQSLFLKEKPVQQGTQASLSATSFVNRPGNMRPVCLPLFAHLLHQVQCNVACTSHLHKKMAFYFSKWPPVFCLRSGPYNWLLLRQLWHDLHMVNIFMPLFNSRKQNMK